MDEIKNNIELSYEMHREHYANRDEESRRLEASWFQEDTVDFWRHLQGVKPLQPLFDQYKKTKWVTLGDGRFGLDSIRLKQLQPELEILPTDIDIALLKEAKEKNLIKEYNEENAEALSFRDDEFDFCFCKESFHHFPRPYIALYEMLRVAKEGVILVEPNERRNKKIPERITKLLVNPIKKLLGKSIAHLETWSFEESGNYIYCVSKDEMEKVALGIQLPAIAYRYYNDYYEKGVEFEKAVLGNNLFEKVKNKIRKDNLKCTLGMQTYSSITVILFKRKADAGLRVKLEAEGFSFIDIPENPFLKKDKLNRS